ncbi:TEF4 [[Candida] subhashii]|uniref:TEF4 n=1 Tax=[Candida] subhashii TaxID=561895 RepID=A0A8J5QN38_9ASCO|nr:TEF4 [[Candida] subhashii]KAG7663536.1 TEF4 [[Candida] subhashii]
MSQDVTIKTEKDEAFTNAFPLGKLPAFIGTKGFKLYETLAIATYLLSLVPKDKIGAVLGKNNEQYASVIKYLSLFNQEFIPALFQTLFMINGRYPYNKKQCDENFGKVDVVASILESRLAEFTFLVGERASFADFFAVACLAPGLQTILAKPFAQKYPNITRWFTTVSKNAFFGDRFAQFAIAEKPLVYTPPKKEKKPAQEQQPKKEKKEAKPAAPAASSEEPAEAPKPKHPLELLGRPKAALDEWKRVYSNEETRETAIPWFWKNQYDPEEWSLWKVDYKYNDELTLTFMSNNLVGGFFNRLSASTKYMFGCMVVYGENNNNGITGAFLVRGQDYKPAFDVAPDWESYEFTKLDANDEESKKFIDNMFAWDQPVIVNGESKEIADGKVFK